jgi:Lrp/AsnC family transcriptional regulator, leucine-responsive regulatory protein
MASDASRFARKAIETVRDHAQDHCVVRSVSLDALDALDVDLLNLLQRDAGRTLRELGDDVGLSPSAVHRRIARYEAAGLIARRVAVLDRGRRAARCWPSCS